MEKNYYLKPCPKYSRHSWNSNSQSGNPLELVLEIVSLHYPTLLEMCLNPRTFFFVCVPFHVLTLITSPMLRLWQCTCAKQILLQVSKNLGAWLLLWCKFKTWIWCLSLTNCPSTSKWARLIFKFTWVLTKLYT